MRKRLVLIRHGKSLYDDYVANDMERHLAARGYHDVEQTALWLKQNNIFPDAMVSSPAIRAYSTCLIVANHFSFQAEKVLIKDAIYEASDNALLYVINELPAIADTVFLFGHNPAFTSIVSKLTNQDFRHLPTSAAVIIEFNQVQWNEIDLHSGNLTNTFCCHKAVD
jgi:phosphohistidine phosphatase